jgi:hypothetical protein
LALIGLGRCSGKEKGRRRGRNPTTGARVKKRMPETQFKSCDIRVLLPQLWDTHTHLVNIQNQQSIVTYQSYGDCLLPAVFVLDFIP